MQNCPHCGAPLRPAQRYCAVCGVLLRAAAQPVPATEAVPVPPAAQPGGAPGALFIWSLILVFLLNPVGAPLGALAALCCCAAHAQDGVPSPRAARLARGLCVTGSVCTAAGFAYLVFLLVRQVF